MKQKFDLTGKTIVITGATAGIGHAAAKELAARGANVIGIGRSASRCQDAQQAILEAHPEANLSFKVADLSSQRQIRRLAAELRHDVMSGDGKIDVLVNNAGTVSSWYAATEDGYELQFAVNHLAPFLLTHELLPLLEAAPGARVLTVSSGSHYCTRMRWADVMLFRNYNCLMAYKQSKLANVLFTAEFNRRSKVRAYAVDPGLVHTDIGLKGTGGIVQWVWERRSTNGVSPEQGAETVIFLASAPTLEDPNAIYWKDCQPKQPSRFALRQPEAARLWELSKRLCGISAGDGVEAAAMPNQTFTGSYA